MGIILGILAGISVLLIWAALTRPKGIERPQADKDPRYRLKALRSVGFMAAAMEDLAAWFQGEQQDGSSWRGGLNDRYMKQLKQANWYWAPNEKEPPVPDARFWNLETLWAAKVFQALLFGLGGLLLAGALSALVGVPVVAPLVVAGIAAVVGFFDPDSDLAGKAEERRRQIILEMGTKVPEMRTYILSGVSLPDLLRRIIRGLTDRPGGPFVEELSRALQVYASTSSLSRGLELMIDRNQLCQPMVNLCGDMLSIVNEGGELGKVLDTHADMALHEQRRLLRQQGQENTQNMSLVVSGTTMVVIFLLTGGPALWVVLQSL
jgi:hypothetical protein